ncbi:MAG TPA: RDD family protein [Blastocatellia bacterium]|nr:RDD family protein [Blastocatellia bacterium]
MSEKVKEIRAKKLAAASACDLFPDPARPADSGQSARGGGEALDRDRTINPTVEAALARVRRAGLGASYEPLGVGSHRGALKASSLSRERAATAPALEPVEDPVTVQPPEAVAPKASGPANRDGAKQTLNLSSTAASYITQKNLRPEPARAVQTTVTSVGTNPTSPTKVARDLSRAETRPLVSPAPQASNGYAAAAAAPISAGNLDISDQAPEPIDEIEPVDYLEAEVRKVDERLSRQEAADRASHLCRAVSGFVDCLTIGVSALPFIGLILYSGGSLTAAHTQIAGLGVVLLISLFYLALTQGLSGKTFGMMVTNTRVVETGGQSAPSLSRVVARSLLYLLSIAPAAAGILWMFVDPKGRTWHDLLSGTAVIRDF